MNNYKQQIGKNGEEIAREYLTKQGLTVIQNNYHTRYGEIDLIAKDQDEIVFIEVKTRRSQSHGQPQEAVNYSKQKNLILTARLYLKQFNLEESDWRIDVIEVKLYQEAKNQITHIKNAVTYF